ncbi:MAG: peroxiredoxin family protein, partial [Actinobacteria bacterium]|nr:peroxiredoxin family protein [Actinomycetota bacterium]
MSNAKRNNKKTKKGKGARVNRGVLVGAGAAVFVGTALLAAIFIGNSGGSAPGGGQAGKYPYQVGDPGPGEEAPPIALPSTEGGTFDLASTRGETVLLYFQEGLTCQACWDQMKDIEAQWGEFEDLGIDRTVSITHDPLDASKQKVESEGISTP